MTEANSQVFCWLDDFCAVRNDAVRNANTPRWISSSRPDKNFLIHSKLTSSVAFGAMRRIVRLDHGPSTYFCTVGFDHAQEVLGLSEEDLSPGVFTTVIAETKPRPSASVDRIRDVVEFSDRSADPSYDGHDWEVVSTLFPNIKVFRSKAASDEDTWRIFFLLCVSECMAGGTWINETLATSLKIVCELELINVPYRTLCRSIFDADPGALFLALYRCLEALYAYSSARKVIDALGLACSWDDVATTLEDELGWHPREETSLSALLERATRHDLSAVFSALNETAPSGSDANLSTPAGKRIYKLRNALVHYRPSQHRVDHSKVDWNKLCESMAFIIFHIYTDIFPVNA